MSESLDECAEDGLLLPELDTHQVINDIRVILRGTVFESLMNEDSLQEDAVAAQAVRLVSAYLAGIMKADVSIPAIGDVRPLDADSFHCRLSSQAGETK